MSVGEPVLRVRDLSVSYGAAQALVGITFDVPENSAVAVLGPNGAGKSTVARAISGLVPSSGGSIEFDGRDVTRSPASVISRSGLLHLPEGRGVFPGLTVRENLRMALTGVRRGRTEALERAFSVFPVLAERGGQPAGTLSGGEQQMLSLARAFVARPRLIVADELSLGLSPKLVDAVFAGLEQLRESGVAVLMVEQFAARALAFADHCLILQRGRLSWAGRADDAGPELVQRYLGAASKPPQSIAVKQQTLR
jgi:branched-chain amino acid transport system ATP-binding protein